MQGFFPCGWWTTLAAHEEHRTFQFVVSSVTVTLRRELFRMKPNSGVHLPLPHSTYTVICSSSRSTPDFLLLNSFSLSTLSSPQSLAESEPWQILHFAADSSFKILHSNSSSSKKDCPILACHIPCPKIFVSDTIMQQIVATGACSLNRTLVHSSTSQATDGFWCVRSQDAATESKLSEDEPHVLLSVSLKFKSFVLVRN